MKKVIPILLTLVLTIPFLFGTSTVQSESIDDTKVYESLVQNENMKARILWYDLSANAVRLNTPEGVKEIVEKTANANFNTIVLDVKGTNGHVAYPSEYSPHVSESANVNYQNFSEGYDLIEAVLNEAKKYDLEVHININTFAAGNIPDHEGPAMENEHWQTVVYDVIQVIANEMGQEIAVDGFNITRNSNFLVIYTPDAYDVSPANRWGVELVVEDDVIVDVLDRNSTDDPAPEIPENGYVVSANGTARTWVLENFEIGDQLEIRESEPTLQPISETNASAAFMNPIHPEVKQYTWNTIRELVENYDIDGITLDRARYNNVYTDFSDLSREKFEEVIGQEVANWPEDIFTIEFDESHQKEIVPGPLYGEWIKWRAQNIEQYFEETRELVKSTNPDVLFNTYVGSWHPLYYSEGVNWASKNYHPDYDWATPDYHETGYAEHLDFLMTGLYYPNVYIEDLEGTGLADWYSVEGAADISMEATQYEIPTYGSLYILQYHDAEDPEGSKQRLREAIEMSESRTHGIMIFDLVYLEPEWYDWWDVMEEAFTEKTIAPHSYPVIEALDTLVSEATSIMNGDEQFTTASFQALQDQIQQTMKDIESLSALEETLTALQEAVDGLITTEDLRAVLTEANDIKDVEAYTAVTYEALQEAITIGESVLINGRTEEEVTDAIDMLTVAMDGLVEVGHLQEVLEEANQITDASSFSTTTYHMLQEAIEAGESALIDGETKADITEAITLLQTAMDGLIDVSDLATLRNEALTITDPDAYTDESYEQLQAALAVAEEALDNAETEETVASAFAGLEAAFAGLELVEKDENPVTEESEGETGEQEDETTQPGEKLPETATSMYTMLLIGFVLMSLGMLAFIIYRYRKKSRKS